MSLYFLSFCEEDWCEPSKCTVQPDLFSIGAGVTCRSNLALSSGTIWLVPNVSLKVINMYRTVISRETISQLRGNYPVVFVVSRFYTFTKTTFSMWQIRQWFPLSALLSGLVERAVFCTSLNDVRLSFLAMNFLRWRTVACAEQRIHLRFRPRSLLLLHSKQMLTC